MSKIAVFGSKGMLGHAVCRYFAREGRDVVPLNRERFDIATAPMAALDPLLDGVEVVINCAGLIKPMIAKHPIEAALMVNSIFPRNLARYCDRRDMACVHITTDCVYNGSRGRYTEEDYVDCTDTYGLTKAGGDAAECMVLRTSIVGEELGQSRSLLEWARSQAGKSVGGFTNHLWNGVTTVYLAEIIDTILRGGRYTQGLFHIHSPDAVTKLKLVSIFSEVYGLNLSINPTESPEACDRSLASIHGLTREVCVKPIGLQVQEMRSFFNENAPRAASRPETSR